MPDHTTHFNDCGCLSARYEAQLAAYRKVVDVVLQIRRRRNNDLLRIERNCEGCLGGEKGDGYCWGCLMIKLGTALAALPTEEPR